MMFTKYFASLCLLPIIIAAPISEVSNSQLDTASYCGRWNSVNAGQYSLLLNQWGSANATSGSVCAAVTSLNKKTVAWKNSWIWEGGYQVKSFTNIQLNSGLNKQLSAINSIKTTWRWSQTSSGPAVADVAYDLFTSSTPGGKNLNEIMIWLANFDSGPISSKYNSNGTAIPIATDIPLAGYHWNLYFGSNGVNNVYSFLPSNNVHITSFKGDLNVFFKYLTDKKAISTAQFLKVAQAGTEAISGSATFTTSAYSLVIR